MNNSGATDTVIVFDLDDTLYKEADYVRSGVEYVVRRLSLKLRVPRMDLLNEVSRAEAENVHPFDALYEHLDHKVSVRRMVEWYRKHVPYLIMPEETRRCLETLTQSGYTLAMITDGRTAGQWNKIHALGVERYIPREYISVSDEVGADKNKPLPWKRMVELLPDKKAWWYIGDNPRKDFHHPNAMGWNTVMLLDDGRNIKTQNVSLPGTYFAKFTIDSLDRLPGLLTI
ncbi:MAG: HAD hydrolase-like protein [Muribaculaceae bacterium]|nr:HAD hydrolase-like protein [Muribaculaceae bacterium]